MTTVQYTTFVVGGHHFGVEVADVQEVIRYQPMTPVPLAPRTVGGLINLRGQVITAIDLRRRLELPDRPEDELPMNVVVRTDDGAVSLLVDSIGAVVHAPHDSFEPPPETLVGPTRSLIRGAYKLDGSLLLALDVTRAVDTSPALAA
jgi:purine-binding chemotaxis protein CheW